MSGCDEEHGGGVGADSVEAEEAGRADGDERDDRLVQPVDLGVEELHAAAEFAQRDPDGVVGSVAGDVPQGRDRLGQGGRAAPGEPCPPPIRAGSG